MCNHLKSLLDHRLKLLNLSLELSLEVSSSLEEIWSSLDLVTTIVNDFAEVGLASTVPGEH